jgi:hypothetical protein
MSKDNKKDWTESLDPEIKDFVVDSGVAEHQFSKLKEVAGFTDRGSVINRQGTLISTEVGGADKPEFGSRVDEVVSEHNKSAKVRLNALLAAVGADKATGKDTEAAVAAVLETHRLQQDHKQVSSSMNGLQPGIQNSSQQVNATLGDQTTSTKQKASRLTKIAESVSNLKLPVARSFGRYIVAVANYINSGFKKEKGQDMAAARKNFVAQIKNRERFRGR